MHNDLHILAARTCTLVKQNNSCTKEHKNIFDDEEFNDSVKTNVNNCTNHEYFLHNACANDVGAREPTT